MPGPAKSHDLKQISFNLGGFSISGYGDGGAVEIAPVTAAVESSVGQDGQVTYAESNDARAKVTVTLRMNSRAYQDMHTLFLAQRAAPIKPPLPFLLIDNITGERFSSAYCHFLEHPTSTFGRAASDRVFVLELPNGFEPGNFDAAPLVLL